MKSGIAARVGLIAVLGLGLWLATSGVERLVSENILIVDEKDSYDQIIRFTEPRWEISPGISTARGYHFLIAVILKVFNNQSTEFLRVAVLLVNLLAIPAVYVLARAVDEKRACLRMLQFMWMPIIFPFFGLMYTDLLSLSLVVFGTASLLHRKYLVAGILASASLFVRQNNVVWVGFLFVLAYIQENGYRMSFVRVWRHLIGNITMVAGIAGFFIFVLLNGGVAIGESDMHPFVWSLGNVYFFVLVFLVLFLPVNLIGVVRVVREIREHKWIIGLVLFWAVVFLVTFSNSHPFNQSGFFLRNRVLVFLSGDSAHKLLFYLLVVWGILSLSTMKLIRREFYWLLPMVVILLAPEWLIEQRYYMIPLTLLLVFRKVEKPWIEYLMLGGYIAVTMMSYGGIIGNQYFL